MKKRKQEKKVYIFTVTAGAGHLRAAEAMKKAYDVMYPEWEVKIFDVLNYTNPIFKKQYSESYLKIVETMPELWGLIYDKTDSNKVNELTTGIRNFFNSINAFSLIRLIKENPPDVAICTHFLPAEILSDLTQKREIEFPWACIVTDFEVHNFWVLPNINLYIVATPLAKYQLQRNGINPSNIVVLGIPINPEFTIEKDKIQLKEKLGLDSKLKTIMVMSGGFGLGPVESIVKKIDEIDYPMQLIVISGKNKELEKKLKSIKFNKPAKVIGFAKNVDELFAVSDLLISKPGGLTTSEALSQGLPMVIVNAIPGQETRNCDYLLENGVAINIASIEDIGFRVHEILKEEGRIEKMKKNALELGKPLAAKSIVEEIQHRFFD